MAIEFQIEEALVRVKADRAGTEDELRRAIADAVDHPEFQPGSAVLVDVRAIREAPSSQELSDTGRFVAQEGRRHFSRIAMVAVGTMQFGLTRMFGTYADSGGLEVQVFESEEKALAWLGQR